ncbi:MAG TPA: DUF1844 domain-containing protein [Thermoanaerobaculia bacterium]
MPKEKKSSEPIKVTDKRIFTSEGEIKEEFRGEIRPSDPSKRPPETPQAPPRPERPKEPEHGEGDKRKTVRDKASNPGTPFTTFIESLVVNAYISLGLIRGPYQTQPMLDLEAARQMIDIIAMLAEKTKGNLTEDESDFLAAHLSEMKLYYVQRSKAI